MNIAFPLQNFGYGPSQIDEKIKEVARLQQIEPLIDRKPTALSGGQQQRVAWAGPSYVSPACS